MTLRVRKSDVDAFSQDKMSLKEFQKKAAVQSYVGSAPDGSPAAWNQMSVFTEPTYAK